MSGIPDIHAIAASEDFNTATFDFLYPAPINELRCRMGLAPNCDPQPFQCRYTANQVLIHGTSESDIRQAKKECAGRGTCHIEPVGGEGGLIETPIRDAVLAQDVYGRNSNRKRHTFMLQALRITIVSVIIMLLYSSWSMA